MAQILKIIFIIDSIMNLDHLTISVSKLKYLSIKILTSCLKTQLPINMIITVKYPYLKLG